MQVSRENIQPSLAGKIRYEQFVLPSNPHSDEQTRALALCYRWTFGTDSSWREGMICHSCTAELRSMGILREQKWSFYDAPEKCDRCGREPEYYWPTDKIISNMIHEARLPHATTFIALYKNEVVGATFGFVTTPEEIEKHFAHEGLPLPGIAQQLRKRFPDDEHYVYQDELYVRPSFQMRGIGTTLYACRHAHFAGLTGNARPNRYLFRTMRTPATITFDWFTKPGWDYQIVAEYRDADDRVILSRRFNGIPVSLAPIRRLPNHTDIQSRPPQIA